MSSEPILPWQRTFAEGVAIVVSILLAFAIDAWWEDRRSTSRLNDAYSTILADLRDSKERIAFYRARTRVRSEAIVKLYELADENAADIDPEELDRTLGSLQWSVIENIVRSSGIQALIYSGELASVQSEELRSDLADWPNRLQFMRSKFEEDRSNMQNVWFPFLRKYGDVAQVENTITHIPGHPSIQVDPFPIRPRERFDHSALLSSREFRNILTETWVIAMEILSLYDRTDAWIDESTTLIQAEIERLGN